MEQEIREALEKATKGPWVTSALATGYVITDYAPHHTLAAVVEYEENGKVHMVFENHVNNRYLIANTPTYLEWCLSQIAELRVKLEKSEAEKLAFWQMVKERGKEIEKRGKERLDYQDWVTAGMRLDRQRHDQEIAELRKENERLKGGSSKWTNTTNTP